MTQKKPKPTEAEMAILGVLWARGPSTVREIHEALQNQRNCGYTTTLKLLTIMIDKGLVSRDDSRRSHVYKPLVKESQVERQLIRTLLDMAFRGSPARLVMRVLCEEKTDPEELETIRKVLDELERKQ